MLYGIRGHDLGRRNPGEALPFLKQSGYECVQLVLHKLIEGYSSYEDEFDDELLATLKESAQKSDFEIALLGCYQDLSNPALEETNLRLYRKYAGLAAKLGTAFVGTESAALAMPLEECSSKQDFLLKFVPGLCNIMAEHGVSLLLESVGFQPLNEPALCQTLMHTCPQGSLKFVFDPANILRPAQKDEQETLWQKWFDCTVFTDNVVMVHFKDYLPLKGFDKQMTPLGEGCVDFDILRPYIRALPNLKYAVREGQDPEFAGQDLAFMHSYFA